MAAPTAAGLVQELGKRLGEFFLSTAAGGGTTTTLVDTGLLEYLPEDVLGLNAWCYGTPTADSANRGLERRVKNWDSSFTKALFYRAWAIAPSTGEYEFHLRTARSRKLAAINSAIRQLRVWWYRDILDTTLTTIANQWTYDLPSTINWSGVTRLELQVNETTGLVGYPFASADWWDVRLDSFTNSTGVQTWRIQFGNLPPPGRTIRLYGPAGYSDLVNDADVLPLPTKYASEAQEWVFDWATYKLNDWEVDKQPAGQVDRYRQRAIDKLQQQAAYLADHMAGRANVRLLVPGRGTGHYPGNFRRPDSGYLAAFVGP